MPLALKIDNLHKVFKTGFIPKRTVALDGVSLEVEQGEIYGLLGPNGAGKTTTIKCILGLIRPDSGKIELLGKKAPSPETRARTGFLAENPYVYDFLTGREYLIFSAGLFGFDPDTCKKKAAELLALFRLEEAADRTLRKYSKGMLQRIGLAQALINDPDFLILDEPMSGLDPVGRKEVRDLLFSLKERGRTLLFSSHILSDAEVICDRVAILVGGKLQTVGRLQELMSKIEYYEITIRSSRDLSLDGLEHEILARSDSQYLLRVSGIEQIDGILALAKEEKFLIESIVPQRQTLEDLYLQKVHN